MKLCLVFLSVFPTLVFASVIPNLNAQDQAGSVIEELNPFDPNVEQILKEYDKIYEAETGLSPFIESTSKNLFNLFSGKDECYQLTCKVYGQIVKETQKMYLYLNGELKAVWDVSTGTPEFETPLLNTHANGRIYTKYSSTKYPEGDYKGLGNMPYAIFIEGGFAVHGTPEGNWKKLGQKASHGCIRIHPDNAKYLNDLVRFVGFKNAWFSVQ